MKSLLSVFFITVLLSAEPANFLLKDGSRKVANLTEIRNDTVFLTIKSTDGKEIPKTFLKEKFSEIVLTSGTSIDLSKPNYKPAAADEWGVQPPQSAETPPPPQKQIVDDQVLLQSAEAAKVAATTEAGKYERKSVCFPDGLIMLGSARSLNREWVAFSKRLLNEKIMMARFDYNLLPETMTRTFSSSVSNMRDTSLKKSPHSWIQPSFRKFLQSSTQKKNSVQKTTPQKLKEIHFLQQKQKSSVIPILKLQK